MKIVLHSDDINLLNYWEKSIETAVCIDDFEELRGLEDSLIILNYSAFQHTHKNVIEEFKNAGNSVLVLHRVPTIETAKELLSFGADGYGNALMKEHFLLSAIDAISEGLVWLHPEFTSALICEIPSTTKDNSSLLDFLSSREQEVTTLLKDGDTYKSIAQKLSITPRTVKAHAHSIYTKLNVKDRLALALLLK